MTEARLALVHDRLYVGLSCRETEHVEELDRVGITHWADHRRTRCDLPLGSTAYLWNPMKDDGAPKPRVWYERTISFAREALAHPDGRLLVTCAQAHHRGPSMAFAVLRTVFGFDRAASLLAVAQAWPTSDPWYADDIDAHFGPPTGAR